MARAPKKKTAAKAKKTVKTKSSSKPVKKPAKAVKKAAAKTVKKAAPKATQKPSKKTTPAPKAKAPSKSAVIGVGASVPDFSMPATQIGAAELSSLKGKPFVLYFYPRDDTSGCTAEACEFRNNIAAFNKLGAIVIGVSKDGMDSHEKFSRKYNLNFPLASDESGEVCEKFGVWVQKSMYGRSYMGIERSTFLIDAKGVIRNVWRKVSVSGHIDEVKKAVEAL